MASRTYGLGETKHQRAQQRQAARVAEQTADGIIRPAVVSSSYEVLGKFQCSGECSGLADQTEHQEQADLQAAAASAAEGTSHYESQAVYHLSHCSNGVGLLEHHPLIRRHADVRFRSSNNFTSVLFQEVHCPLEFYSL